MSARAMVRRAQVFVPLALAAALGTAPSASAQEVARQRTGPDAASPPVADYAAPVALPLPAFAAPSPAAPTGSALVVRDVSIRAETAPDGAPPSGWRPIAEKLSGLTLDHLPGEALDAGWVHRQFEHNGLIGGVGTADRALALVQLINATYLTAGYINSGLLVRRDAPLVDGMLNLDLIYGKLATLENGAPALIVRFADDSTGGLNADYIESRMPSALRRPLNGLDIERDFRLLADDPAIRTVNADLRPGSRPGEASLLLLVDPQDRVDFYVTGANSRSPSVGGERIAVGGSIRNALFGGDIVSTEAGMTEGLDDYTASYSTPLFTPALSLTLRGSINNAAVVDSQLVPLDIRSRDRAGEAGLSYRFVRRPLTPLPEARGWAPAQALSFGVLIAQRRSRSFLLGQPFSFSPGSVNGRSKYTALRLTGDYLVRNVRDVFAVSVTGSMGLDGTRSNIPGALNPDRHFKALLVQLNYARRLTAGRLELRGRLTGQMSDSVLYSGERLSSGGERTVRGYRENLLLTDKGAIGSIELSQPLSLSPRNQSRFDWGSFAVAAFADGAVLRNHGSVPLARRSIYSVGGSLSWLPSDAISARVSYGVALREVSNLGNRDIQDHGLQFSVTLFPLRLFD